MTLSSTQLCALRAFHRHVVQTNCGPQVREAVLKYGPGAGGGYRATWESLRKMGYVVRAGNVPIEAGNFRWSSPAYAVTEAGTAAYLAERPAAWVPPDELRLDVAKNRHGAPAPQPEVGDRVGDAPATPEPTGTAIAKDRP